MTTKTTGVTILILVSAVALIGAYFLVFQKQFQVDRNSLEKVTIAVPGGIPSSLIWISRANQYFEEEGLEASFINVTSGKTALEALREGRAQITASGDYPVTLSILSGDKIFILAETDSDEGNNIIGRKDLGVSVPTDLKGKKIGLPKGTAAEFQLYSLLSANEISATDVVLVDMPFTETVNALATGKVDAVSARQSDIIELQKNLGNNAALFSTKGIYTFTMLLVGRQDFVIHNPETTKKIIRALLRAETFVKAYPAESRDIVSRFEEFDKDLLEEAWPQYHFSIKLSQPLVLTLEDETRWLMEQRMTSTEQVPNYLDYIYFDALEAAKPDSVTVPHQ